MDEARRAARAANPGVGPAEEAAAGRLAREIERLKEALAKAEAKLAADPGEVGKLERQLKAAKTELQNLKIAGPLLAGGPIPRS